MIRSFVRIGLPLIGGAVVGLAVVACSSSSSTKKKGGAPITGAGGSGGMATDGGSDSSTGGAGGSAGGAGGAGGSTGGAGGSTGGAGGSGTADAGDAAALYTCMNRTVADPGGNGAANDSCCGGLGTCKTPASLPSSLGAAVTSLGHDTCAPTLKCAPTDAALAEAGAGASDGGDAGDGGTSLQMCHTKFDTLNLEGRCLPTCFLKGNTQTALLKKENCPTDYACAPCFNPTDGSATGACTLSGDSPQEASPGAYEECGQGDSGAAPGICVPETLAAAQGGATAVAALPHCHDGGTTLCVPKSKVLDPNSCFKKCTTGGAIAGLPGACVPRYVIAMGPFAAYITALVPGNDCNADELCAPCLNPVSMPANAPTGACDN